MIAFHPTFQCAVFCGPGAAATVQLALTVYRNADLAIPISIVTPAHYAETLRPLTESMGITLLHDESIEGFEQARRYLQDCHTAIAAKRRSTGWYLQQYLKIALAWTNSVPLFIHDGDTIFAPKLLRRMQISPFLMTTREDTAMYNAAIRATGIPTHDRSFVANGGLFMPHALQSMAANPLVWFKRIMDETVLAPGAQGDFSEYQFMGSLLKDQLSAHRLRIFRRFDLLAPDLKDNNILTLVLDALSTYDAIAFESLHTSSFSKRLLGRLAYNIGYSW